MRYLWALGIGAAVGVVASVAGIYVVLMYGPDLNQDF